MRCATRTRHTQAHQSCAELIGIRTCVHECASTVIWHITIWLTARFVCQHSQVAPSQLPAPSQRPSECTTPLVVNDATTGTIEWEGMVDTRRLPRRVADVQQFKWRVCSPSCTELTRRMGAGHGTCHGSVLTIRS